jgi:anti-sigma regulatory factor (Ser/Thr protein kinase)
LARDLGESFSVEGREVAQLLVSELVTNAVRHSDSDVILLDIGFHDDLRVAVTDASPQVPQPGPSTSNDRDGRGLLLVDSLAKRWGVDRTSGNGKRVWFELSNEPSPERRVGQN